MKLAFQICQNVHFILSSCIVCSALLTTSRVDCFASYYVSTVAYLLVIVYIYFFNQIAIFTRLHCPLLQIMKLKLLPSHPTLHMSSICPILLLCARPAYVRRPHSWRLTRSPMSVAAAAAAAAGDACGGQNLLLAGARRPLTQPETDRERHIPRSSFHVWGIRRCRCQRSSSGPPFHISPRRRSHRRGQFRDGVSANNSVGLRYPPARKGKGKIAFFRNRK